MTVYFKGKEGRIDFAEKNVKRVKIDAGRIEVEYLDRKYGIVSGAVYFADEVEIERIDA